MSTIFPTLPALPPEESSPWPVKRFTVEEYHRLIQSGLLNEDDQLELLDGWLVEKMPKNPPHDGTIDLLMYLISQLLPAGWFLRIQNSLSLPESEPEPDVAVVRGKPGDYLDRHPEGSDVVLVIEVADSSVDHDRKKRRLYARAGIAEYWIVNLEARQLEIYTTLKGRGRSRDYSDQRQLTLRDSADLAIAGKACGSIAVSDMIKV